MRFAYNHKGVSFRHPSFEILEVMFGASTLHIAAFINDRDTGERISRLFNVDLPDGYSHEEAAPEETAKIIRKAVLMLVNHELDELLRVDATWQDPHDLVTFKVDWKVKFE